MNASGPTGSGAYARALGWVREAYPDGVPPDDYAALLLLLREHLSAEELAAGHGEVATLVAGELGTEQATAVALGVVPEGVRRRVAGRLVAGGWPLGSPVGVGSPGGGGADDGSGSAIGRALGGIVQWLRSGYPHGVPESDYIPLVAILERRLTKAEVRAVKAELRAQGLLTVGEEDISEAISTVLEEEATPAEVERVTRHLRKKGWPVELS